MRKYLLFLFHILFSIGSNDMPDMQALDSKGKSGFEMSGGGDREEGGRGMGHCAVVPVSLSAGVDLLQPWSNFTALPPALSGGPVKKGGVLSLPCSRTCAKGGGGSRCEHHTPPIPLSRLMNHPWGLQSELTLLQPSSPPSGAKVKGQG